MTFEEIKPDIFYINRDMPRAPAAPCLPPLEWVFTCQYHISNRPKTRSQGFQRNVLALFHLHDDIYVKTDKLQSPLNVRDLSHCFRREDGRPTVDTSRHPNYAWRVNGVDLFDYDISLLPHTRRRSSRSPSTVFFP